MADKKAMEHVLIIGASHAGLACAERLRQNDFAGQITIFEQSPGLPLQRPPLSKTYLKSAEDISDDHFLLRKAEWFETFNIALNTGCEVSHIAPEKRQITLTDQTVHDYSKLIIATGANARKLPQKGGDAQGVHTLRLAEDARRIRQMMAGARKAVIVGGGYIGLEVAASLRQREIEVHLIEMAPRILARVASQPLSDYCMKLHQSQNVTIHINTALSEIVTTKEGHCSAVRLSDGTELPADMVIAGIGVQPADGLVRSAGLDCGNGIQVSSGYQTNDPHIWAIGDVAFAPDISPIRIESIHHAQYSGAVAAAAITSTQMPQKEAWWFWSDQYDVKFQMAGILPSATDETTIHIVRPGKKPESQSVWTWHQGRLVCVEAANDPQAYMIGKKCLEMGINPETVQIASPDFVLKTVLS